MVDERRKVASPWGFDAANSQPNAEQDPHGSTEKATHDCTWGMGAIEDLVGTIEQNLLQILTYT